MQEYMQEHTQVPASTPKHEHVCAHEQEAAPALFFHGSTTEPEHHPDSHSNEFHHHHYHGPEAQHVHGHHLLQVEDLSVGFTMYARSGLLHAQRRYSLVLNKLCISVHEGEIVALVGASGSGKTVFADALMGLYEPNATVEGIIYFDGELQTADSLQVLRGNKIAFVPQSVAALDPLMRVGKQIGGTKERRYELFAQYHLDPSVDRLYPHQLSGGMARRVLLCCALMSNPKLIIADEPTPGLDLELAVQAMDDFRAFANAGGGVLLITHDIELALRVANRVAVFKEGTVIEEVPVEYFARPELLTTEFSKALWHALPSHSFAVPGTSEEAPDGPSAAPGGTNGAQGSTSASARPGQE